MGGGRGFDGMTATLVDVADILAAREGFITIIVGGAPEARLCPVLVDQSGSACSEVAPRRAMR